MSILLLILKTILCSNNEMSKWEPYDDKGFGPNRKDPPKTNTEEFEIRYYGMTESYLKTEEIYHKSKVLEDQEIVDLPDLDVMLFDEVRDLAIDKESEDTIILKDVTNIFDTISLLNIKDEDLPLLYKKILNVHSLREDEFDYTFKLRGPDAIKLSKGFAVKNDMDFNMEGDTGIITSEGETSTLNQDNNDVKKFLINNDVKKFLIYKSADQIFSNLGINHLKLYSRIFKKAKFVELYICKCNLSNKFINNLKYLNSVGKIYFLECVIPEGESKETILKRLNFENVSWDIEEVK